MIETPWGTQNSDRFGSPPLGVEQMVLNPVEQDRLGQMSQDRTFNQQFVAREE